MLGVEDQDVHEIIIVFCGLYKYYTILIGNTATILSLHEVILQYSL